MVRAPEYEEMDRARVDNVPRAFEEVFGKDSEYYLKEYVPMRRDPPAAGPIERSIFHVYLGKKRVAEIHQNGHIDILDESIRERMESVSEILEKAAGEAYRMVKDSE